MASTTITSNLDRLCPYSSIVQNGIDSCVCMCSAAGERCCSRWLMALFGVCVGGVDEFGVAVDSLEGQRKNPLEITRPRATHSVFQRQALRTAIDCQVVLII